MAVKPKVILLDEPTSALDPISTAKVETLVHELKSEYTVAIVTHNMQQAARVSDFTVYMYLGELIEYGRTDEIFLNPRASRPKTTSPAVLADFRLLSTLNPALLPWHLLTPTSSSTNNSTA